MSTAWSWLLRRGAKGKRVSAFVFVCSWGSQQGQLSDEQTAGAGEEETSR